MRDGIAVARKGKPAVAIVTSKFRVQGDFVAGAEGLPDTPRVEEPPPVPGRGAAPTLRQTSGTHIPPIAQREYAASINTLRITLGAASFEAGWAEGSTLSYEQAITLALAHCS